MTVSLALVGWAAPFQMLRRRLEALEAEEFVAAAAALGASRTRRLLRHVLPGAMGLVVATLCMRVPLAMLAESTASFLGFGLPPTEPSLGTYFGQNYKRLLTGEWRIVVPTWALFVLATVAFRLAAELFERGILTRRKA
jgi:peptide/nickel transport system permease protein